MICQEKPHLSLHQPQALSSPPLLDDRVPVAVGLFLVLGHDHEADRLVGLEVGAAVEADEGLAEHGELDRQLLALLRRRESRPAPSCAVPTWLSGKTDA